MPLTDLVRHLNLLSEQTRTPGTGAAAAFIIRNNQVQTELLTGPYKIEIGSRFDPIVSTATACIRGHQACLVAGQGEHQTTISLESLLQIGKDDSEKAYLETLFQTLHTVNYLTQPERGQLILNTSLKQEIASKTPGKAPFQTLLHSFGFKPENITLKLHGNLEHREKMQQLAKHYQTQGHPIALHIQSPDFDLALLEKLNPKVISLTSQMLELPAPRAQKSLRSLSRLQARGVQTLVTEADAIIFRNRLTPPFIDLIRHEASAHPPKTGLLTRQSEQAGILSILAAVSSHQRQALKCL